MSRALALALATVVLAACRSKSPPAAAASPSPTSSPATKVLQAVELTPYAGVPVRKDLDAVIDANAKHNQDIQGLADPKD
ncbi:hypothetical protein BH09VER1_BH09VER1_01130 [soil metagenome]